MKRRERKECVLDVFSIAACALDSFPPSPDFLHRLYSLPVAPERCRGSSHQQHASVLVQSVTISQLFSPMSQLPVVVCSEDCTDQCTTK